MNSKKLCIHTGLFSHDAYEALMYLFNSDELYNACPVRYEMLSYTLVFEDSTGEAVIVPFWNVDDEDIEMAMKDDSVESYDEFVKYVGMNIKEIASDASTTKKTISVVSKDNGRNLEDFHNLDDTELKLNKKTVLFLGDWLCKKDEDKIRKKYGKKFVDKMIGTPRNIIDVQMLDSLKDEIDLENAKYNSELTKLDDWYDEEIKKLEKELDNHKKSLQEQHDANVKLIDTMREDIVSGQNIRKA